MFKCRRFIGLIVLIILLSGCNDVAVVDFGPKKDVVSYVNEVYEMNGSYRMSIDCDFSSIEIYSWDKNEMKLEIAKRIRGIGDSSYLEKMLKDFKIDTQNKNGVVSFTSRYNGNIKSVSDKSLDLKVHLPRGIRTLDIKSGLGKVKILDDLKCDLTMGVSMVDTEINSFSGKLKYTAEMGNIKIGEGKIEGDSNIKINQGNINIKAELFEKGFSSFETEIGNIEMLTPENTQISFENLGTVDVNEFEEKEYPAKLKLSTDMGKISIKKYIEVDDI